MSKIKIKFFEENVYPNNKLNVDKKCDWIDLRCRSYVKMNKGEYKLIPLGVAMELPKGYEAHVVPRSSTFKNYGIILVSSVGIIDESYCGANDEWMMPAYAIENTVIEKGDRICQFRIFKHQPKIKFIIDDLKGNDNRGGFGSTGIK